MSSAPDRVGPEPEVGYCTTFYVGSWIAQIGVEASATACVPHEVGCCVLGMEGLGRLETESGLDGLEVHGEVRHSHYRVLTVESSTVPNALAALLFHIRDVTGYRPHIYFEWTEGHPVTNLLHFLLGGVGEVAPVTREVVRRAERDRSRRPHVHAS